MLRNFHWAIWLVCSVLGSPLAWGQGAPSVGSPDTVTDAQPAGATTPSETPTAQQVNERVQQTPEVLEEARRRFDRGVRLYTEGDYALALIEFDRAYELVSNYRVLYNIGQVSIQLRQYARAREALEQYLSEGEGEIDDVRLAEVQADIEMLKTRTAKLTVLVNVAKARVFLDGKLLGVTPLPEALLVDAGSHSIEVERTGFRSATKGVTMAGGDDIKVNVTLELIPPERTVEKTIVVKNQGDTPSTWKWVGWGTAGLFAAGAVTTGIFGLNAASDLEDLRNTPGVSREALDSSQSRARRMFMASDILAVGALAAAGVSLYLTFGSSGGEAEDPTATKVGVGPGSLSLSGAF